jgi:hypothetical protein
MRRILRYAALAAAVVALGVACRFTPGKPYSWRSSIDTEFDIDDGADRQVGLWQFQDPFELSSGKVALKFSYHIPKSDAGFVPNTFTWHLRLYDETLTTMKFQYDLSTTGKMKPGGGGYKVSFKGKDSGFTGWNVSPHDNLVWSLEPQGGSLRSGTSLGIQYTYWPK